MSATVTELHSPAQGEAERSLVALCLVWPENLSRVSIGPEQIFSPRLRDLFATMLELDGEGRLWEDDLVCLHEELERRGKRMLVPDSVELLSVGRPGSLESYEAIVREAYITRQVKLALSEMSRAPLRGKELLSESLSALARIHVEQPNDERTARALAREQYAEIVAIAEARRRGEVVRTGIPTGFDDLDKLLGGLQRGIVTIAAGRPAMGKSSFAMTCADGASAVGVGAHVFSLEDTRSSYAQRLLSRATGVPVQRMRSVEFNRGDLDRFTSAAHSVRRENWLVDDRSGITADEIVRSVRRRLVTNGTGLVIVDYLQLVQPAERKNRDEQLSEIMRTFSVAAKRDNISYLVLSQLNRDLERRDDKRPMMADLRGSGGIEENAKCIIFPFRPSVYDTGAPSDVVELIVSKNNQGPTGVAEARFDAKTIRMY